MFDNAYRHISMRMNEVNVRFSNLIKLKKIMQVLEHVPDSVKLAVATVPPGLYLFGIPMEHWILILSAIASLLVIIEKLPKALDSIHKLTGKFKKWRNGIKHEQV